MNMVQQFDPAQVDFSQDLGTPGAESDVKVTVHIDGMPVSVPEGTSVMRAAAMVGANIPKLCATDNLNAFGSCRLCLVEIEGRPGTPASCTTPCAEGMSVHTQTPRLDKLRKGVMELYISDHPLDCLTCPANGDCELQDMAGHVLQFTVTIGGASEAIEGMVRNIKFHHALAEFVEARGLGMNRHALCTGRGARGGCAGAAFNLDQTEPAGTKGIEVIGGTELRDVSADHGRGAHH